MFDIIDATVATLTSSQADVRQRSQEANGFQCLCVLPQRHSQPGRPDLMLAVNISADLRYVQGWHIHQTWHITSTLYVCSLTFTSGGAGDGGALFVATKARHFSQEGGPSPAGFVPTIQRPADMSNCFCGGWNRSAILSQDLVFS